MNGFRIHDLHCSLGYDCGNLTPSAHRLESSVEFKTSARTDFARNFDFFLQDRSFTRPYAGTVTPRVTPRVDAFGDIEPSDVLTMADEVLQAHATTASTVSVIEAPSALCIWDPIRKVWINTGGFHFEIDGGPYTADRAVSDFESAYRAARPSVPTTFDADLVELRAMRAVLFVSWPVR